MQIAIERTVHFTASPERTFATITATDNMQSFVGYGPIPGILEVRLEGELGVGGQLHVKNTDGSTHREQIEVFEPARCYQLRIGHFDSPMRLLTSHAIERLEFFSEGDGCRVERTFRFSLTSPLASPLALPLVRVFFARALDRNHERLRALIEGRPEAAGAA